MTTLGFKGVNFRLYGRSARLCRKNNDRAIVLVSRNCQYTETVDGLVLMCLVFLIQINKCSHGNSTLHMCRCYTFQIITFHQLGVRVPRTVCICFILVHFLYRMAYVSSVYQRTITISDRAHTLRTFRLWYGIHFAVVALNV